jgi:SAM-dependent methyltransferase
MIECAGRPDRARVIVERALPPYTRGMSLEQAQRHYCGEAGRRYSEVKRGIPEQAVSWVARLRARKFSDLIDAGDVVFEYGVGTGWNLAALQCRRKIGFDVADGVEATVQALGIEFVADTKLMPEAVADVVLCHHSLEHVLRPPEALTEMRRLLKPQGRLLLYVPLEREARYEHFRRDEPNHHLYSWNVQTLGNLVQETGFKVTEAGVGEFGYSRFAAVWAAKLHLGERGFRFVRGLLQAVKPAFEVRLVAVKDAS